MNNFAEMFEQPVKLPWPELEVPEYSEASNGGGWKLEKKTPPMIRGYFNGLQIPKNDNWVLTKDNTFWMSLTPMETESQAPHAAAATGHTVIMGFGMGMLAYNVPKKPEVTKVTVIEIDPEVYVVQRGPMNQDPSAPSSRPHFQVLRAVKNGRIVVVDEQAYSRPGPRAVDAVEALAKFLHPERF